MMAPSDHRIAVVGGGPAGLMAAEALGLKGLSVDLFDAMPSVGRKFLLAGKGGLNLTHSESSETFFKRYGELSIPLEAALQAFGPEQIRAWAESMGIQTFKGSSGRIFPEGMKAAPLLRAWIRKLRSLNIRIHIRHRWVGWTSDGDLLFDTPSGEKHQKARAVIFAMGGASWPKLGSNGSWIPLIEAKGIAVNPFVPSNCGFLRSWSEKFSNEFQGAPIKTVSGWTSASGPMNGRRGEFNITRDGIEGGLVYSLSRSLRNEFQTQGQATLYLDLAPDRSLARLQNDLDTPGSKETLSTRLRKSAGLSKVKIALMREIAPDLHTTSLPTLIKSFPLSLEGIAPIEKAISSAGGIVFASVDENLMSRKTEGHFFAGEMLDWEAPTGGYLLTACLAMGRFAGHQAADWVKTHSRP